MRVSLEDWKNGWFGIELSIAAPEIDRLISLLQELKADPEQHFHISSDYKGIGGVGDIEVFVKPDDAPDNLFLSSPALQPGDEI
jgi:hypothetical protein